jgi:hypothetical protein
MPAGGNRRIWPIEQCAPYGIEFPVILAHCSNNTTPHLKYFFLLLPPPLAGEAIEEYYKSILFADFCRLI